LASPTRAGQARTALLFDLDGTLVDSAPDLHASLNHLLTENGRPTVRLDDVRHMVGDGAAKMIERGFKLTGGLPPADQTLALLRRFLEIYSGTLTQLTHPFPGVVETLQALRARGARCAVCTNKLTELSRRILDDLGLSPFFEVLAGGDSTATRKPHPGHLLHALERMDMPVAEGVMIGDSYNDVAAARAAGMPVILVPYGYGTEPPEALGADHVLRRFAELPQVLQQAPFTL
jgi:phosphoglycolate phosphatase